MESPTSSQNQPETVSHGKTLVWIHWLLTALVAAAWGIEYATIWTSANLPDQPGWPDAWLISLATASTVVALARRLPLQNVLGATLVIAIIGGAAHAIGEYTDLPFGPFVFEPAAGSKLFRTLPWAVPLLWAVIILNSRGVARLILRPWRKTRAYGFWIIGLTAVLVMGFDVALDPFFSHVKRYWLWMPTKFPVTWQGTPLVNFLSWAAVTLLVLAFATPLLINKRPRGRSRPDYHPLGLWLGALLLFGGAAALNGLWPAVVMDAVIGVTTAFFAIRGARW